jgi:hypothetical protein
MTTDDTIPSDEDLPPFDDPKVQLIFEILCDESIGQRFHPAEDLEASVLGRNGEGPMRIHPANNAKRNDGGCDVR